MSPWYSASPTAAAAARPCQAMARSCDSPSKKVTALLRVAST